jgi:hypothetical protein
MTRPPDELTPAERAAFAALPREADVSDMEEERIVQALRTRGLLGTGRHRRVVGWPRWVLRVAAALLLFLGGVLFGRRLGPARSPEAGSPVAAALQIQRTGSSFVRALSRVSESGEDPAAAATAREVARRVLETGQSLLDRSRQPDVGQGKTRIVWF